jgi:hypothetical protein
MDFVSSKLSPQPKVTHGRGDDGDLVHFFKGHQCGFAVRGRIESTRVVGRGGRRPSEFELAPGEKTRQT